MQPLPPETASVGASKMAWQAKVLAAKSEDLSSTPGALTLEERTDDAGQLTSDLHTCWPNEEINK